MSTRVWTHVGLVALFAAGAAGGILWHHHHHHGGGHGGHGHAHAFGYEHHLKDERHAAEFTEHFRKRLDLNAEQTTKVGAIIEAGRMHVVSLAQDFQDKFKAARSVAWKEIRATLTEKQVPEFEKLVDELEKMHGHP